MRRTLYAAALALISTPNAFAHDTPDEIIEQAYPQYSQAQQCRIATHDDQQFCMRMVYDKIADTAQNHYRFIMYHGQNYDFAHQYANDCHMCTGLLGLFVFKQSAQGWQLADALPKDANGSWGEPPEEWTFQRFGKDKFGFFAKHGYGNQGFFHAYYDIFLFDGEKIRNSTLSAAMSYDGWMQTVDQDENAQIRHSYDLDSDIKIDDASYEINGFYPIRLSVYGEKAGKPVARKTYTAVFNPQEHGYHPPKDYPLYPH